MTTINALNKNTSWKSKHKPKKVEVGVSVPKHGEISCQADTADTMISRQRRGPHRRAVCWCWCWCWALPQFATHFRIIFELCPAHLPPPANPSSLLADPGRSKETQKLGTMDCWL